MSIYLGSNRAGVSHVIGEVLNEGDEVLRAADKEHLEDAVSYRVGHINERSISQMINDLKQKYMVDVQINLDMMQESITPWVRPVAWPDLDSLNLSMEDGTPDYIYMTYDATSEFAAIALHIEKVSNGTDISCTIGHIENGSYIIDETITGVSNNYVYWFENYPYNYPVVRVTGDIKYCYTYTVTNANNQQLHHRKQPILERIAYVPHLVRFCISASSNGWTTYTLEREKVGNGAGTALTHLYYAWGWGHNLRSLDITNIRTPNVVNMEYCFYDCFKLTGTLDVRHFTTNKVTTLNYCFSACPAIECIDIRGWDYSALSVISACFNGCNSLKEIKGIENIITTNCTTFTSLFGDCLSLKELDLSSWNTGKVTSLASTFYNCNSLTFLDISTWDTSKVTSFSNTFYNCMSLETIDVSNWDTSKATTFGGTFSNCRSIKILDLSNWTNGTLTSVSSMFTQCNSLQFLDISNIIITSACTSIYSMFSYCMSLREIQLNPNWDVSGLANSNSTANSMFASCFSVKRITGIKNWQFYLNNSLASMFGNCYSLKELDVSGWRVNSITSFSSMFSGCYSLENLDVSQWNVSSATNIANMFQNCFHLKELNLANWNLSNCTTIAYLFSGCYELKTVGDLSNWNTANITTMNDLFSNCRSLIEIKGLSNWDVRKVTNLSQMFYLTRCLKEVKIENWNLAACTNLGSIFRAAWGIETLSLKNWSIPKIASTQSYFCTECYNLKHVLYTLPMAYNHSYTNCVNLTHESLLTILNTLPTVTTTRTLNLTTMNINMLTAEEKAIATNKGWTLAN